MSALAEKIRGAEDILNYRFTETRILQEALSLPGVYSGFYSPVPDGNKNLALVGDAVIKTVLVIDGYKARKSKGKYIGKLRLSCTCKASC